jgi:hypothetical protein
MDSSLSTPGIPDGRWTRKRYYESLSQYDESTQKILDPVYRSEHFPIPRLARSPRSERVENGESINRYGKRGIFDYLKQHRYSLFALIPLVAAMLETSTLIYFFMAYVFLPSDPKTGALPRISGVYSTWPFTSCIGSLHLAVYKTFAFVVASLYESGSLINLYLDRNKGLGYWFQCLGNVAGLASTVLLIWLVFASENIESHTHLYIVGVKILAVLTVKGSVLMCDRLNRKANPILNTIPAAIILRRWREVIMALSIRK